MVATRLTPSLRRLAERDVTLAVAAGILVLGGSLIAGTGAVAAFVGAALCVPLAWRSRWPLRVLAVIALASLGYLVLNDTPPVFIVPVTIAVYTAAVRGTRARTLAVGAALLPYAVLVAIVFSPDGNSVFAALRELLAQLGFALAAGEAVRTGRALLGALRQRAEEAEHTSELEAQRRVDAERVRMAREVHDIVAHSLATISTQAAVGTHLGQRDPERGLELLASIKTISTEALQDLRHALGAFREDTGAAPTAPTPSLRDLPALVDRCRGSGLTVALRLEGAQGGVPVALQAATFRIVQEGLTNVMRHAHGAPAVVRVAVDQHGVEVDVSDDGTGHPTASSSATPGSGLIGMRERALALGGDFEAGHLADGGFRVHAALPLDGVAA